MTDAVLVLNAGSSSIKFAVYDMANGAGGAAGFRGMAQGLGGGGRGALQVRDREGATVLSEPLRDGGHDAAMDALADWLKSGAQGFTLKAVGHRVVHGGTDFAEPVLIDDAVLDRLERLTPLAPLHEPQNLAPVRRLRDLLPALPQVACFDTAFHRTVPRIAQLFALPREYAEDGVIRYGFHGLSYQYIARWLAANRPDLHDGRVVVAHLGNGASLCALREGRSVATSMGFTALDGLPMGNRCGSLDPGVVLHLMTHYGLDAAALEDLLYHRSGLLGLSGISHDVRDLLASDRAEAREALAVYCYRAAREIGSLTAALGGLDCLVFTAGVGENAAPVRSWICEWLEWLGVRLDAGANARNAMAIGADEALPVLVVPTDEEGEIARDTLRTVG